MTVIWLANLTHSKNKFHLITNIKCAIMLQTDESKASRKQYSVFLLASVMAKLCPFHSAFLLKLPWKVILFEYLRLWPSQPFQLHLRF